MQKELILSIIAWTLAGGALAVHLAVPLGVLETQDGSDKTDHGAQGWDDVVETGEERPLSMHEAPFASRGLGTTGAVFLILGTGLVLVSRARPYTLQAPNVLAFGLAGTALGAFMLGVVHAMWTGTGITASAHAMTGMDPADLLWPIAPPIVVAMVATVFVLTFLPLRMEGIGEGPERAGRHVALGIAGLVAVVIAAAAPWTAMEGPDALGRDAEGNIDEDRFAYSAKDVLALQDETRDLADKTGEGDLVDYVGLGALIRTAILAGGAMMVAAAAGLAGILLAMQDLVAVGRNLEFSSMVGIAGGIAVTLAAFAGPLFFYLANDADEDSVRAFGALLATLPGIAALMISGKLTAQVLEVNVPLQTDDFDEPIVFE